MSIDNKTISKKCTDTCSIDANELYKKLNGKKILHFGSLAGWPYTLANVSRKMGIPSDNVIHTYKDVAGLERKLSFDKSIFRKEDPFLQKTKKTIDFLLNLDSEYGLIHYHSSNILHREYHFLFEGPYLRHKNIPMVLSLGGGDARFTKFSLSKNKFFYRKPSHSRDLMIKLRWLSWKQNIAVCATDPEMLVFAKDYFDNVSIFRQPIDIDNFPYTPLSGANEVPLLLHVPTEPWVKGTDSIVDAISKLEKEGLRFKFTLARNLTQTDFYKLLSTCDVYIDELRCGSHGVTAVEAMAMGKPTITYIRDDLISNYPPDLPLINANPDTIEDALRKIISNHKLRSEIGNASREYVEKYHDAKVVVNHLATIYKNLL